MHASRLAASTVMLSALCLTLGPTPGRAALSAAVQTDGPPKVLLDQPARAVEYQIARLTTDELARVERKPDDPRYRPLYVALLTRSGMAATYRDEALTALVAMDRTSATRVLLEALAKVPADDSVTSDKLLSMLLGQATAALRQERAAFVQTIDRQTSTPALLGAYAGVMLADGAPAQAWQLAATHAGHTGELLRSLRALPTSADAAGLRSQLWPRVSALAVDAPDIEVRAAALYAIGWIRSDRAAFDLLATALTTGKDTAVQAAAVRSLLRVPQSEWASDRIEPLSQGIVALLRAIPAEDRTAARAAEAVQLGEWLTAALPDAKRSGLRRDLRSLGVRVVRIETIFEQMAYDRLWFAVEAGKPAQIAFTNRDAMPHNVVIGRPGSLEEIGNGGAAVPLPTDPEVKPYVPVTPNVLGATGLIKEGQTERLNFTAPTTPGEYVFLCTFPGHWVRMYGVMLVVPDLEAWEATPKTPTDPMTKQPFLSETR